MTRIGDFGTPAEARDVDTFGYFGVDIRVNPTFTDADLADFMEMAGDVDETNVAASMGALKQMLRDCIHPEDFDRFWALAKENGQDLEKRMQVAYQVIEAVSERPTTSPAGSPGGQTLTGVKSPDSSSSRVIDRLAGRPDLQVVVARVAESQTASA